MCLYEKLLCMNSLCTSLVQYVVYLRKLYNEISTKVYLANIKADEAHSLEITSGVQTEGILQDVGERHTRN